MAAGVGVHTVLHLRWLAHMTRRIAGRDTKPARSVVPAGASRRARMPATAAVASAAAGAGGSPPGTPRTVAADELERLERRWNARRREHERRHTRKAFLTGGGVVRAQNPDACRLCGRCTQVCRPGAITLSA